MKSPPTRWAPNAAWWAAGLVAGVANAWRHRIRGYRTPRRFPNDDYDQSLRYARKVVDRWIDRSSIDLLGRDVLEIGPGPDLLTGVVLLGRGARSYLAVDLFPLATNVPAAVYRAAGADPARLKYQREDFPALTGVRGSYDLVVSNATLEHIADVPALFRRLSELVPAGGLMVHHVDAKTHTRPFADRDPLNVFRFGPVIYRAFAFPGMLNRLLSSDYLTAAENAGFDASAVLGTVADDAYLQRTRVARAFRDRDDLSQLSFTLVCRRR
jgi:cyclopropane fatty-acyl-phospholipid synthase-like methyltransferase